MPKSLRLHTCFKGVTYTRLWTRGPRLTLLLQQMYSFHATRCGAKHLRYFILTIMLGGRCGHQPHSTDEITRVERLNIASKAAQPTGGEGLEHRSIRFQSPRFKPQHHALDTQASRVTGWGGKSGFRRASFVSFAPNLHWPQNCSFDPAPSAAGHPPGLSPDSPLRSWEPGGSAACTSQCP